MRFQFQGGTKVVREVAGRRGRGWRGAARLGAASTALHVYIYLQIPNNFQYVETRWLPSVDPLQYHTPCETSRRRRHYSMRRLSHTGAPPPQDAAW